MIKSIFNTILLISITATSCNSNYKKKLVNTQIKTETIIYNIDTASCSGYIAYDSISKKKRPIVFVIHEWWGQNEYVKRRVRELAGLGYVAMALDLYGNNKVAKSVEEAVRFSSPFYKNSELAKKNYEVALSVLKKYSQADTTKITLIGYCFGGSMALEVARMGEQLNGVVSFHGGLVGRTPQKDLFKAKVLICQGADDQFVKTAEVNQFKKQMDSIGANYKFVLYDGATHAFSNPDATEWGKKFNIPIAYNKNADTLSWNEMKQFLNQIFH